MKFLGHIKESGKQLFRMRDGTQHTLCKQIVKGSKHFVMVTIVSGGSIAIDSAVNGRGESAYSKGEIINVEDFLSSFLKVNEIGISGGGGSEGYFHVSIK